MMSNMTTNIFTIDEYVGLHKDSPDWTPVIQGNAQLLMTLCSRLKDIMESDGIDFQTNPKTGSIISGEIYGGFRPQDCPIGAANSSHKMGKAVDIYDPTNNIDAWLMLNQNALVECDIYIEHPSKTMHWSHWAIKTTSEDSPKSGHHVFFP